MEDISRGVRSFAIGTAFSRVLGLVRETVIAGLFGAGFAVDAYNVAFRIPNLLRDLFAETALSAAFVPVLTAEKAKSREAQNRLASNVFNVLFVVAGGVSLAGLLLAPVLAKVIAFGFHKVPGKIDLTTQLTAILFPFLLFISLAAWAMSYLNTEKSFFVPSLAPAVFNLFSILFPLLTYGWYTARGKNPIFGLTVGVLVGGLMQFLVQAPSLWRRGFRWSPVLSFRDPEFRKVMALFIPVAIGLAGTRINVLVNTILVTPLAQGSVSWLNYAFRIMHLPLGLFGIAVGTVALPSLSRLVLEDNVAAVKSTLTDSLKMVLFLTVPTSALICGLAVPLTRAIYERGRFSAADTLATAAALVLYAVGIPFASALRNVAAVFYAYKDARTPMYASFASIGLNLVLNISLMWVIGYLAFPLSTTLAAALNVGLLYALLPRKIGGLESRPLAAYAAKLALASAAGGGAAWIVNGLVVGRLGVSFPASVASVAAGGALGLAVFFGVSRLLGVAETRDFLRRFLRK
ncbi:MAG TPA: murein biosynthesis integral membrane protein MurJ [Candidatus Aminicenantes bacterium]|nr:murein biosynthesis integral membrane protein MurJ [Candidatus Aminicenantes bacterium]HRY63912.1 murein biosynthesis integral membrane protein MurJ [Candidatus Aminicenantes bacterium]HRZ70825.1 murein biosynthesis integral membrane protein MurJ [Candidatus Aminicenantes bacterium]